MKSSNFSFDIGPHRWRVVFVKRVSDPVGTELTLGHLASGRHEIQLNARFQTADAALDRFAEHFGHACEVHGIAMSSAAGDSPARMYATSTAMLSFIKAIQRAGGTEGFMRRFDDAARRLLPKDATRRPARRAKVSPKRRPKRKGGA